MAHIVEIVPQSAIGCSQTAGAIISRPLAIPTRRRTQLTTGCGTHQIASTWTHIHTGTQVKVVIHDAS